VVGNSLFLEQTVILRPHNNLNTEFLYLKTRLLDKKAMRDFLIRTSLAIERLISSLKTTRYVRLSNTTLRCEKPASVCYIRLRRAQTLPFSRACYELSGYQIRRKGQKRYFAVNLEATPGYADRRNVQCLPIQIL
jgi:hypothetical protein